MSATAQHKNRTLWLVGALHAFTHLYQVALLPLYLLMQRDFGFASVGQATSLVTVQMVAYFLPSYAMGVLADRVSRKKLLGYGLLLNALGFGALAFAPNYPCALVAVIVAGIGGSFYHPAATAAIARMFPVNTGRALGLVGTGAGVGFCIGPLYSGWRVDLLETTLGAAAWRRPVLELSVLGLLATLLFFMLADEGEPATAENRAVSSAQKLFPTPMLWLLFLAGAFAFSLRDFAGAGMGTLGSLFLQQARGFDARLTGLALCGMFLASAVSNPLFGHLSDGARKRWAAAVLLISMVLVALLPHLPARWLIPALVAHGFFFLSSYPMVEAELMQAVPDAVRGRVFGLFITVGGLLGNLSHWIVGEAVRRMGDKAHESASYFALYALMAGLILISLTGLSCLHAIRKREHLEPEHSALRSHHSAVE